MANENALKLVFANKAPADRLLAFEHGFAGRTLALASVTDNPTLIDTLISSHANGLTIIKSRRL